MQCLYFPICIYIAWKRRLDGRAASFAWLLQIIFLFTWILSWYAEEKYEQVARELFFASLLFCGIFAVVRVAREKRMETVEQQQHDRIFRLGMYFAILPLSAVMAGIYLVYSVYTRDLAKGEKAEQLAIEVKEQQDEHIAMLDQRFDKLECNTEELSTKTDQALDGLQEIKENQAVGIGKIDANKKTLSQVGRQVKQLNGKVDFQKSGKTIPTPDPIRTVPKKTCMDWVKEKFSGRPQSMAASMPSDSLAAQLLFERMMDSTLQARYQEPPLFNHTNRDN